MGCFTHIHFPAPRRHPIDPDRKVVVTGAVDWLNEDLPTAMHFEGRKGLCVQNPRTPRGAQVGNPGSDKQTMDASRLAANYRPPLCFLLAAEKGGA